MGLSAKSCEPCKGGIAPLAIAEARELLSQAPGWRLIDGSTKLYRSFRFNNFMQPLDFVNKVGGVAEGEQHHPDIGFGWGYCNISIQTHKIGGLHQNDFILAAKINDIGKNCI